MAPKVCDINIEQRHALKPPLILLQYIYCKIVHFVSNTGAQTKVLCYYLLNSERKSQNPTHSQVATLKNYCARIALGGGRAP